MSENPISTEVLYQLKTQNGSIGRILRREYKNVNEYVYIEGSSSDPDNWIEEVSEEEILFIEDQNESHEHHHEARNFKCPNCDGEFDEWNEAWNGTRCPFCSTQKGTY